MHHPARRHVAKRAGSFTEELWARHGAMDMGTGPYRIFPKPDIRPYSVAPRLVPCRRRECRRTRHDRCRPDLHARRCAPLYSALRARLARRDRFGRARRLADDDGSRPVGESAVTAFLGSAAAVAAIRLARPRPCRRGQHNSSGARTMTDLPVSIADIKKAEAAIAGTLTRTPLVRAAELSDLSGCEADLKLEKLQTTRSLQARGARENTLP